MTTEYATLKSYLERTGKMKLLPTILRELRVQEARKKLLAPRKESAKDNPSLISGSRSIENGVLTDTTGERALLDIYKKITT